MRLPSDSAVSSRNFRRLSVALRFLLEFEALGIGLELEPEFEFEELGPEMELGPELKEFVGLAESRLVGGLSEAEESQPLPLSNLAFMLLTLDLRTRTRDMLLHIPLQHSYVLSLKL